MAHAALAELCQTYWPPLYTFVRSRGYSVHDAQDLTQIFFQRIVEDETLRRASPERGRFRSFLLGALTRCLADEHEYLRVLINSPSAVTLRVMREAYELAGQYLRNLAEKTGGRLYRADDPAQLARAFSMIAEELRHQSSLGYYPKSAGPAAGGRRQIRVRVRRPGLAVRARDNYVTAGARDGGASR